MITGVENVNVNLLEGGLSEGPEVANVLLPVTTRFVSVPAGLSRVTAFPVPVKETATVPPGKVPDKVLAPLAVLQTT